MLTLSTLPETNEEGLELVGRHVSAERAKAFQALGLRIVQGRREGVRIWDLDGTSYLNCRSSGGVFNFGHRPGFAIQALKEALDQVGDVGDWLVPSAVRGRARPSWLRSSPATSTTPSSLPAGAKRWRWPASSPGR